MQNKKRLIFAHRGLFSEEIPENSMAAFQRAIDKGIGIELDVRLTRDKVPVVFHDRTLIRMCGDKRRISRTDYSELKKLTLGRSDEKIPTLKEVLELIGGKVPLLIETKLPKRHRWHRQLERRILPMLKEYSGDLRLQSFNRYSADYLKRKLPHIPCGILSGSLYAQPKGFDFISFKLSGLSKEKMRELKEKYPAVFLWTTIPLSEKETEKVFSQFSPDAIIL